MELLIEESGEAVFVQKLLNLFDLNVKILTRDKGYMLYIKEADKISDFLKIIKANNAVLYFENQRIYRNQKNQANRLNNCEQANMDKVVATATAQLDDIAIIEDNLGISLLDDKTQQALEYRKKYPEASLKELSEIISLETGNSITKSGLNHRFRKIKELATRFKKLENKKLPENINYEEIKGLRLEARQKLNKVRPLSVGQASRISGVSPADISVLLIYLETINRK